jgi:hypothetical protein
VVVSPSQPATPLTLVAMTRWRPRPAGAGAGSALASSRAISTVAFQVRNSLAVKWAPARSAM